MYYATCHVHAYRSVNLMSNGDAVITHVCFTSQSVEIKFKKCSDKEIWSRREWKCNMSIALVGGNLAMEVVIAGLCFKAGRRSVDDTTGTPQVPLSSDWILRTSCMRSLNPSWANDIQSHEVGLDGLVLN